LPRLGPMLNCSPKVEFTPNFIASNTPLAALSKSPNWFQLHDAFA
jgi:hypothetical protein